jgi:arginine metabolism regulation protein II
MCNTSKLTCGGYEKNIFFGLEDNTTDTASGDARFRRPVLTEAERKRMSDLLTSTIPPRLALWHISKLDEECEEAPASQEIQLSHGPFGAFKLSQTQPGLSNDLFSNISDNSSCSEDLIQNDDLLTPNDTLLPWTQNLSDFVFGLPEQGLILSTADFWDTAMDSSQIAEVFDTTTMPEIPQISFSPLHMPQSQFSQTMPDFRMDYPMSYNSLPPRTYDVVSQDVVFLLKHYSTTILGLLTPFRHTKTPWHVLFIPNAKHCLAALTLGEKMDDANLAAFNGILAISASSLGNVHHSDSWLEKGRAYKQKAREYTRMMLKTAYEVPKVAKYKSILMALLTMVQLFTFSGSQEKTECYFLEAEMFIRLRGLNRKKSRKVRLLHHCYAYERIFYESTIVLNSDSSHRHHVQKSVESSQLVIRGQDSLSFQLSSWRNLEEEMMELKSQDEGENDLHLERPGNWPQTLYPEIFGIPESWILLVSLILRLGKEKDASEQDESANAFVLKDFFSRAKSIEKCINQLQHPAPTNDIPNQKPQGDPHLLKNMLDATQQALAIYFYRKIYDIDASMLQQRVVSVRDCLLRCGHIDYNVAYSSVRLIWPAFIAAREAKEEDTRASFASWFREAAQRSGLRVFANTLENIQRIWLEME